MNNYIKLFINISLKSNLKDLFMVPLRDMVGLKFGRSCFSSPIVTALYKLSGLYLVPSYPYLSTREGKEQQGWHRKSPKAPKGP